MFSIIRWPFIFVDTVHSGWVDQQKDDYRSW